MNADDHFFANEGVIFQFMPHVEEEAALMINNLIPYLIETTGDYVKDFLWRSWLKQ